MGEASIWKEFKISSLNVEQDLSKQPSIIKGCHHEFYGILGIMGLGFFKEEVEFFRSFGGFVDILWVCCARNKKTKKFSEVF